MERRPWHFPKDGSALTLKAHCCLCNSMLFRNNPLCAMSPLWSVRECSAPRLQRKGVAGYKTMDNRGAHLQGKQQSSRHDQKFRSRSPEPQGNPQRTAITELFLATLGFPEACLLEKGA